MPAVFENCSRALAVPAGDCLGRRAGRPGGRASVFTFLLRGGVQFRSTPYFKPTRAFNADDVMFTFTRLVAASRSTDVAAADEFVSPNLACAASRGGIKFCDQEFDALLDAARSEVDETRRLALSERAQAVFKRERPWPRWCLRRSASRCAMTCSVS